MSATSAVKKIIVSTARDRPIPLHAVALQRAFIPSADAAAFARRIAGRWVTGAIRRGSLDMTLLEGSITTPSVQVHNRLSIGISLAPHLRLTLLRRFADRLPAPRLELAVVRWSTTAAPPVAGAPRGVRSGTGSPSLLPGPVPRVLPAIDAEPLQRGLVEYIRRIDTERLARQLVIRTGRMDPATVGSARSNRPAAIHPAPVRMVVHRAVAPVDSAAAPQQGSGQQWQREGPDRSSRQQWPREPAVPPAPPAAPPNIRYLADEVLEVIDRRVTASRERLQRG